MRLLSVQIQNYRKHRNCTVEFKDKLVLIHGPNESGKSTLVEAIHRALFLKAKGTSEIHKAMESDHGGEPAVEVEFEAGGKIHRIHKTFGAKGTTSLESEGQATLTGDQAETQLATLLGVDGSIEGRRAGSALPKRWAHLWVWQGQSNSSPIDAAAEARNTLKQKLQSEAGHGLIVSELDNRVISALQEARDAVFTATGKLKAGSHLKELEDQLASTRERVELRQSKLNELREAAAAYTRAEADLERHESTAGNSKARLKEIEKALSEVQSRRQQLEAATRECATKEKALNELREADTHIRGREIELEQSRKHSEPAAKELAQLEADLIAARESLHRSTQAREVSADRANRERATAEAWEAHRNWLQSRETLTKLRSEQKKVEKLQREEREKRQALLRLESFTHQVIKDLRKKSRAAESAKTQLEAYALKLELLETAETVEVGDQPLEANQSVVITEPTDLLIGRGTRLRLIPGGSKDLETARAQENEARHALLESLRQLGVDSLEVAEVKALELNRVENELQKIADQLEVLDPEAIKTRIESTNKDIIRYESRRDAPIEGEPPIEFSSDLGVTETAINESMEAVTLANKAAADATAEEKAQRAVVEKLGKAFEKAAKTASELAEKERDLQRRIEYDLERWGDAANREQALNKRKLEFEQLQATETELRQALDKLQPDQLELDRKRHQQAAEKSDQLIQDARDSRIRAETTLRSSGSTDPERELKEAIAQNEFIEKRFSTLRKQAEARTFLLGKLKEAQHKTTAALTKPLETAASRYLQDLFGNGSHVRLEWAEDGSGLSALSIDRQSTQAGFHRFEQLSHGTREQVALAFRLAMAEVLAADHQGCLPLVLDDAFTHADKNRIQTLQRVLYRGTERGLQILVLTCHPENYGGLTAHEVVLT